MATESELQKITADGKLAFESGDYESAAAKFENSARGYAALNDQVNEAEMKNNKSVALLKLGKAQEALDSALGTQAIDHEPR